MNNFINKEDVNLITHLAEAPAKLSDEEAHTMDGKITYEETRSVLKNKDILLNSSSSFGKI